jgi:hypothetical protein
VAKSPHTWGKCCWILRPFVTCLFFIFVSPETKTSGNLFCPSLPFTGKGVLGGALLSHSPAPFSCLYVPLPQRKEWEVSPMRQWEFFLCLVFPKKLMPKTPKTHDFWQPHPHFLKTVFLNITIARKSSFVSLNFPKKIFQSNYNKSLPTKNLY